MGRSRNRGRRAAALALAGTLRVIGVVAAGSVGFAVGDVLTAPVAVAATSRETHTQETADFQWSWHLKTGQTLTIKGINGEIHAVPARGTDAHVTARKHAKRSDPAEVRIEVNTSAEGVTVCAIYPTSHGEAGSCDDADHQQIRNNDVVVDFEAEVPAGVTLRAQTVNGGIETDRLDGPVEAHTVNGGIAVASRGWTEATTVNGSVHATLGARHWRDDLDFTTVNGTVTVDMPRDAGCEVDASTVNGEVETDMTMSVSGRISHRHLHGTIGDGGGHLHASTVNGSIRLLEAR